MNGESAIMSISIGVFLEGFMVLNIINFADMTRREDDGVSCDVRRVSSP